MKSTENSNSNRAGGVDALVRRGRLLVVAGRRWAWKVGKRGGVIAHCETGERKYAHASEIKGVLPGIFERGQRKRTSDGMVTPGEVAGWIASLNIS